MLMLHISPSSSLANEGNTTSGGSVLLGKLGVRDAGSGLDLANVKNVLRSEYAVLCVIACAVAIFQLVFGASFFRSVSHVLSLRAVPQMVWSDANPIVTGMADTQAIRNVSASHQETGLMGKDVSFSELPHSKAPVSARRDVCSPFPTTIRLSDFLDEPTRQCRRATDGRQELWRDKAGIKSPLNKFC